ncbi:MAG: hypothetical protein KAK04_09815 [Cyclobacteriaceae bacterium]|nr:hypothetical protein [Cyclobacteriaceae bacterium]
MGGHLIFRNILIWITIWSQQIRFPVGIEFDPYVFPAGDNGDNLCVTLMPLT